MGTMIFEKEYVCMIELSYPGLDTLSAPAV